MAKKTVNKEWLAMKKAKKDGVKIEPKQVKVEAKNGGEKQGK